MIKNAYSVKNEDFIDHIDVFCPKCTKKAVVLGGKPFLNIAEYEEEVRFSCSHCGYTLRYADLPKPTVFVNSKGLPVTSRVIYHNAPFDPYFLFPVYYEIETKFGAIWAYNLEHLQTIQNYITDKIRSRNGLPNKNNSIASRLPQWAKNAKNREYLKKVIDKFIEK